TPLIALPGSPDRVVPVEEVAGTPIEQVMVGSCTNGSWHDMASVTEILRGRRIHPSISFVLFPGSHRILETMSSEGLLTDLLRAGATVSEPTCGSCAGIGHVPAAGTKSLRAFNRNFPGRSGVKGDEVYLCSSVTAAASALTGAITDPRTVGAPAAAYLPESFAASGAGLVMPDGQGEVIRGPNIKPVLLGEPVAETLEAPVLLKLGDKVSTDVISPAGAAILVFRSNIPAIAEFCFKYLDPEFVPRAKAAGRGILVAGEHYGQGSSREVAAIGPMYLGVRVVLARSFARIHRANLINWGIVPLTLDDPASYEAIESGGRLRLDGLLAALGGGISSLSKACIIGPPSHPGADVDYTFAQVDVKNPVVDYQGNCGNCSSAVGPFAIDERLVPGVAGETRVRIHNTNTQKLIVAHVPVKD